ncbi:MAG TPA: amidohydrolase family protein, partial [Vicinamibacteria bacterium]|nr:amidohydrolase family protein [Vicinamibacteria bacterium]
GTLAAQETVAIVGAMVIDGNGGPPLDQAAILVEGDRIAAIGPASSFQVPRGARIIDAAGKFVTPGFIDTNVHLSLYGGHTPERYETLVRYHDRQEEVVLENAQLHLKYGVTTVRDSYGVLPPLEKVRDAIERGEAVGSRMLVAGNIVGWGGPFSMTFSSIPEEGLTLFQEQMNELVSQGAGEDLMDMSAGELRVAINDYLDKGVDFVKFGGTGHTSMPTLIGFSPDAQGAIVEETHARGLIAETHSTTIEGLRISLEAGVDLVQHPEIVEPREIPETLVAMFRERDVICSMLVNTMTGPAWQEHLEKKEAEAKKLESDPEALTGHQGTPQKRERTSAEIRRMKRAAGESLEIRRANAIKLIAGGCRTTVGTDNYRAAAPELARGPKPEYQDAGRGTILAIEGLVELGMTPGEAIVAATRNGAMACRALEQYGTLEVGKKADLLVLAANPLDDIHNIEKLELVMKEGKVVDLDRLPERPVYYRAKPESAPVSLGENKP